MMCFCPTGTLELEGSFSTGIREFFWFHDVTTKRWVGGCDVGLRRAAIMEELLLVLQPW